MKIQQTLSFAVVMAPALCGGFISALFTSFRGEDAKEALAARKSAAAGREGGPGLKSVIPAFLQARSERTLYIVNSD